VEKLCLKALKGANPTHSILEKNFPLTIPKDRDEPCYAVAFVGEEVLILYSVHREYKLTRGLQTVHVGLNEGVPHRTTAGEV
jgi:hypothetical protein